MTTRLLTLRDVVRITALSRSAVYALMAESRWLMDDWAAYLNAARAEERPPLSEPC